MKHLFKATLALFFLQANITFSQNVVLEVNNVRTLYFGYKNKLQFGTSDGRPFELVAENARLELDSVQGDRKYPNLYTVYPLGYHNVHVVMVDPSSKKAFDTISFNVEGIPDPEIYWGGSRNGQKGFATEPRLFVIFPPEIPLDASWKMVSWECHIQGITDKPMCGTGNDISSALGDIKKAKMDQLNGSRTKTKIAFICTIVGPDGVLRKLAAVFQL
jgi:hypothetical protein